MNSYILNNLLLFIFFLLLFTSRFNSIINLNSYESLSIIAFFLGFFSYTLNINKKFTIKLVTLFVLLIYYHLFRNISENGYLYNPSQYRDYGLFILFSIPFMILFKFNDNFIYYRYIYFYLFTLIALITNSRSIIYFILLIYIINLYFSTSKILAIKYSFITLSTSIISFFSAIDLNSYGDFINRLKFGLSSPTRLDVLQHNIENITSTEAIIYNTHNVLFHIYIYLSKFISIISLIAISIALILNLFLIYKFKLQNNLRVMMLSFSLTYFLFLYCNLESTNLWVYFFTIGFYYGFIYDLFKEKFIVEESY
jgi:hypothetical protein